MAQTVPRSGPARHPFNMNIANIHIITNTNLILKQDFSLAKEIICSESNLFLFYFLRIVFLRRNSVKFNVGRLGFIVFDGGTC